MVGLSKTSARIALDARMLRSNTMHGIARYVYELARGLREIQTGHEFFLIVNENSPLHNMTWPSNFTLVNTNTRWISIKEQWELPGLLKKYKIDLFHSPSFVAPLICPSKLMMTIHDLNHMVLPQNYTLLHKIYYNSVVRYAAQRSSCILTVSEFSKEEIVKYLQIPKEKVFVTYNGIGKNFTHLTDPELLKKVRETYQLPPRFLLCFSNGKAHKNIGTFLNAYLKSEIEIPVLVIGILEDTVLGDLENSERGKKIKTLSYIEEEHLPSLYSLCHAFVFPSLYEGFGLPPLEALACGAPVIASASSSLPEILGEHVYFLDPKLDEQGLKKRLEAIMLTLDSQGNPFFKEGTAHAQRFSWERMVEKTVNLYNHCLFSHHKS